MKKEHRASGSKGSRLSWKDGSNRKGKSERPGLVAGTSIIMHATSSEGGFPLRKRGAHRTKG